MNELSEENRLALVTLYREKAQKCLEDADEMFAQQRWDLATNRYYYACFHACHALFVKHHLFSKSHEGTIRLFNQHFVKTGVADIKFSALLSQLEELRRKADYNAVVPVYREDILEFQDLVHEFVSMAEALLK